MQIEQQMQSGRKEPLEQFLTIAQSGPSTRREETRDAATGERGAILIIDRAERQGRGAGAENPIPTHRSYQLRRISQLRTKPNLNPSRSTRSQRLPPRRRRLHHP